MQTRLIEKGDHIYIDGPLNYHTVMPVLLESKRLFEKYLHIVIDLTQVTTIDSGSLALMLEWIKYANLHKKTMQFKHSPVKLMTLAKISGVQELIFNDELLVVSENTSILPI